jgi:DNA-binding NarL/FixJ family response regulator
MPTAVLLVDDDALFRGLARRMLADMGLTVVAEADTVAAAAAAARELRPEAALVDVRLPDGDGFSLAVLLTALPWRPRVVLTSSDPGVGTAKRVRDSGAVGFIAKDSLPDRSLKDLLVGD